MSTESPTKPTGPRMLHIAYYRDSNGISDVAVFGQKVDALEYALNKAMSYTPMPWGVSLIDHLEALKAANS